MSTIRILDQNSRCGDVGIIILVRHGQSTANRDQIYQGKLDTQLTTQGEEQAKSIRTKLPQDIDCIYSSNLIRARRTAEIVYPGREIITDPRLNEMDLGILEGKSRKQLTPNEKFMWDQIRENPNFSQHEGETGKEFIVRITEFFSELEDKFKNDNHLKIAVFTHFGVITAIITKILAQDRIKVPNVGIIRLENQLQTWKIELL